jgi:hypothetical protein
MGLAGDFFPSRGHHSFPLHHSSLGSTTYHQHYFVITGYNAALIFEYYYRLSITVYFENMSVFVTWT